MSEKRHRFLWTVVIGFLGVLLFAGIWATRSLWILPFVFLNVRHEVQEVEKQEAEMQRPEVSSQVGHSLAIYCQSGAAVFPTGFVGNAWLPKPVRDLDPSDVEITESKADIMMGGGFHHYGYSLERLPNSVQGSNLWALTFYSEGSDSKQLLTFTTADSERISGSNFVANALAEYDRLLKTKREEKYAVIWLEQNRIAFLLQFGRTKVREACMQSIHDFPNRWWPRLTFAFMGSTRSGDEQAAHEFVAWVDSNPSYSRYIYLAYYYEVMGKPESATKAMEKAISYPIVDMDDDMSNTKCRGYFAGVYAFRNGKYSTVIKLCDALLPMRENGDYAKSALSKLRQAAIAAQSGTAPAFQPDEDILEFNPYDHVSLDALRRL